jgi:hypothetical protein
LAEETLPTLLSIGIFASLALLWIVTYVDLARRKDLSVVKKVLWGLAIFFGAYIGIAAYFIMRPVPEVPGKRADATTPASSEVVEELELLHSRYDEASITDADYLAQKRDLLGLTRGE